MKNKMLEKLVLLKEQLQHPQFFKDLKNWTSEQVNEYLDHRESELFETQWLFTFNEINEKEPQENIPKNSIDEIREIVFKKVFEITQVADLAAYCSDDFELISKNICFLKSNVYLEQMLETYQEGKLPM